MSTIRGSINVDKISSDRLFQGKKGRWLDIVLIPTPNSEYGDYMIKENIPYEERQSGAEGVILGNAKINVTKAGGVPIEENPKEPDLPF